MKLLVIAGISGCGKSTYVGSLGGRGWATLNHDDVLGHRIVTNELEANWAAVFSPGAPASLAPFLQHLAGLSQPVALEFGFLMLFLPLVVHLRDAGGQVWWFDGDRPAAQQSWRARNARRTQPYPDQAWQAYMTTVETNWPSILEVFGPNVLRVIDAGPRYLRHAEIDRAVLGVET